jgi:hypothetical protein
MLSKYYSLDECHNRDGVFERLDILKENGKVIFGTADIDVIRIKDTGLTLKELKGLMNFFQENDVIEYDDFEPTTYLDDDEDWDDFEDEDWGDDEDEEEDEY